jgi:hypothetical protein
MPDTVRALLGLLFDPVYATCLILAAVSAVMLFGRRGKRSRGEKAALFVLFVPSAAAVLFFSVMAVIFGPVS